MFNDSRIPAVTFSILVLLFAPLAILSVHGQQNSILWAKQFGTNAGDAAHAMEVDASGDVFVGGRTTGVMGDASFGRNDCFLRRLDACGNEIWTTQIGTADSDDLHNFSIGSGNIFSVGHTVSNGSDPTDFDVFISLTDFDGNLIWQKSYGTSTGDVGQGVASGTNGEHVIVGYTRGAIGGAHSGGSFDGFVTKFDDGGEVIWETQLGTEGEDLFFSVELDSNGNAYVVGRTTGAFPGNTTTSPTEDAVLAKVDSAGNIVWIRQFNSGNNDVANDVVVTENDEIYITGSLLAGNKAFVRKYDSDGTLLRESIVDGLQGAPESITVNDRGDAVVFGYTFNDFAGPNAGSLDAFLIRFDGLGNEVARFQFGSSQPEWGNAVAFDPIGGSFYAAGQTRQTILGQSSVGSDDAFLVRFAPANILIPYGAQRSMLLDLEFSIPADVQIGAEAFSLEKRGNDGGPVTLNVSVDNLGGQTLACMTFSGQFTEASGSLCDGNYQLTIDADHITDCITGIPLDIDGDGVPGGIVTFGAEQADNFYRLFGDSNQSRRVDAIDLLGFRQTYQLVTGDAGFDESFDANLNGVIDAIDLLTLRRNWLKEMPHDNSSKASRTKK